MWERLQNWFSRGQRVDQVLEAQLRHNQEVLAQKQMQAVQRRLHIHRETVQLAGSARDVTEGLLPFESTE